MAFLAERKDRSGNANKTVDWLALWLLFSAWCSLTGWTLSSLGMLNRLGYGISFVLFLILLGFFREQLGYSGSISFRIRSLRSRHWLPKFWLLLASLAFLGGLIYHPNNYDYLAYRFPRVLHWLWEQHWYWIFTPTDRMNLAGTGFEWVMAPVFLFFKTDRLFFLINVLSFCLLPGIVYALFHRLGISKRLSWWWMWVLPCSYCYILQAGSLSNDMFGSVYLLAAFLYIFKMSEPGSSPSRNFFYSCLALALATGTKASNLPLGLPWLAAVYLNRESLLQVRPIVGVGTLFLAGCVSFIPVGILNIYYTGSYTGDPLNTSMMQAHNPVAALIGNTVYIGLDNFRPPVWPSQVALDSVLPNSLAGYLQQNYPRFEMTSAVDQIQLEESGGLGLNMAACVIMLIMLRLWAGAKRPALVLRPQLKFLLIFIATCLSILVMMAKLCNEGMPRLLTPYYPLLVAGVVAALALDGRVIRFLACKILAVAAMLTALLLLVISPARPLFPVEWAVAAMAKISPSRVERVEKVYGVYGSRYDAMKDMRVLLPDTENAIGLIQNGDVMEATLWRPYGSRQIVGVEPDQTLDQLKAEKLHLVLVSEYAILYKYKTNIDDLTKKWSATILEKRKLLLRATADTGMWYLLELPSGSGPAASK